MLFKQSLRWTGKFSCSIFNFQIKAISGSSKKEGFSWTGLAINTQMTKNTQTFTHAIFSLGGQKSHALFSIACFFGRAYYCKRGSC